MNCFQGKEARVNVLSLKLTESALPVAERERTMGTQWKLALTGKV